VASRRGAQTPCRPAERNRMNESQRNDSIAALLRQHDPAAGQVLTTFDRARILHAADANRGTARQWKLSVAFVMTLLLLIAGALALRPHHQEAIPRQVQYATPGGTRIVWTLDPNFKM
jgi:hypothetical protein